MDRMFARQETMLGDAATAALRDAQVAVLGLGGVGGACAEALVRCGVGHLILLDNDTFSESNLNRQLFATRETIGKSKVACAQKRLLSINPDAEIVGVEGFYLPENSNILFDHNPQYIADAIDTVTAKLDVIEKAQAAGIFCISCLGTGNRLNPLDFRVGDIYDTGGCGCALARILRGKLRRMEIASHPVVYSVETPRTAQVAADSPSGRHAPGSISFVPPVAGYILASEISKRILQDRGLL